MNVTVVGGGVIGLACAWRLARAGITVTVIESDPKQATSLVAAGMLAPITEAHPTEPGLLAAGRAAVAAWPAFAAELPADPGYSATGTLVTGYDASDAAVVDELAQRLAGLGIAVQRLTGSECRRREGALAPGVRSGLCVPGDHSVDNRALLRALWAACAEAGVRVRAGTVEDVSELDADVVVVAAGVWTGRLLPALNDYIRPVRGQTVRLIAGPHTPVLTGTVRAVIGGETVYLVPRASGELVVGATQEDVGFDRTVTAGGVHRLLDTARRVFPAIDEYAVDEVVAGLRPVSVDGAPLVGWIDDRTVVSAGHGRPVIVASGHERPVIVASGHGRNGVLLAPLTADLVVHAVTGTGSVDADIAAAFDPRRFAMVDR